MATGSWALTTQTTAPAIGLATADVDDDSTPDIVVFLPGEPPRVHVNERQGRFLQTRAPGPGATGAGVLSDLDGDGRMDMAYPAGEALAVLLARSTAAHDSGTTTGSSLASWYDVSTLRIEGGIPDSVCTADLDGDGLLDLLVRTTVGPTVLAVNRSEPGRPAFVMHSGTFPTARGTQALPIDIDADGDVDLVGPHGTTWVNVTRPSGFLRVSLRGTGRRSSALGIGSRLWVRAGPRLIRREVTGPTELIGLGGHPRADLVRVVWTDGTIQNHLGPATDAPGDRTPVPSGTHLVLTQKAGLSGSCPYLYASNDGRWSFVTDVLAGSPLGLPDAAGGWVPGAPEEIVVVGSGPVESTGRSLSLRITEEYREVTFLDAVGLLVVDHAPSDVIVPAAGIGSRGEPRLVALESVLGPVQARTL